MCVMVWVFIYNKIIAPAVQRCSASGAGLSNLQRMGVGRFTMIISMTTAAIVETKRLQSIKNGQTMSIAWQLPQYFIISGSEVFNYITQLEFFYAQAPDTMRSICTSFALLSTALGNYLSSLIITFVSLVTASGGKPGWIPDDLNKGHLDYYFYSLAGMVSSVYCGFELPVPATTLSRSSRRALRHRLRSSPGSSENSTRFNRKKKSLREKMVSACEPHVCTANGTLSRKNHKRATWRWQCPPPPPAANSFSFSTAIKLTAMIPSFAMMRRAMKGCSVTYKSSMSVKDRFLYPIIGCERSIGASMNSWI
ncbi:hypothetical protein GW17_00004780, partial [Ensete ventricosum]